MSDFPENNDKSYKIRDLINHIQLMTHNIKRDQVDKEKSEKELAELLGHDIKGSCTYNFQDFKVVVKTGFNYRFNKDKYAQYLQRTDDVIQPKYNPVKEITKYELDEKLYRDLQNHGSDQDKYLASMFVTTTDKKLHITIDKSKKD